MLIYHLLREAGCDAVEGGQEPHADQGDLLGEAEVVTELRQPPLAVRGEGGGAVVHVATRGRNYARVVVDVATGRGGHPRVVGASVQGGDTAQGRGGGAGGRGGQGSDGHCQVRGRQRGVARLE